MADKHKRDVFRQTPPVTDADVRIIFESVITKGPYPTDQMYSEMADMLSHYRGYGVSPHMVTRSNERIIEAATLLLKFVSDRSIGLFPPDPTNFFLRHIHAQNSKTFKMPSWQ